MEVAEKNWGSLSPAEGSKQITRSMLDLRKAKPYILETVVKVKAEEAIRKPTQENLCAYSRNNIKLMEYCDKLESSVVDLNNVQKMNFPSYPPLESTVSARGSPVSLNKSSLSNGADVKGIENNLKHGIALIAANSGFNTASGIALQTLNGCTQCYIQSLCKSLRITMDNEALTGKTGFYDCADQVLHDMGIGNIQSLLAFYQKSVIDYNKVLIAKSEKLKLQAEHNKMARTSVKPKQEKVLFSNWIPVVNPASSFETNFNTKVSQIKKEPSYHHNISNSQVESQTSNVHGLNDNFWPNAKRFCS